MNEKLASESSFSAEVEFLDNRSLRAVFPADQRYITNRLGYRVEARDENGLWLDRITIVDDTGAYYYVAGLDAIVGERSELENIADTLIQRALEVYLPQTLTKYMPALLSLMEACNTSSCIATAIRAHLTRLAFASEESVDLATTVGVAKQLTTYLIAHEYSGLSPDEAEEILGSKLGMQSNSYMRLYLMDNVSGPLTREEMGLIRETLDNDNLPIPLDSRVVTQLCVEWGMRPIQIALLKESDFHYNPQNGLYWLNVPRVKQKQKQRRGQFKRRMLSERLGRLIEQMIKANQWTKAFFGVDDMPLIQRRFGGLKEHGGVTSILRENVVNPNTDLYPEAKKHFSFHIGQHAILQRVKEVEKFLPMSPRTKSQFNLTVYRFRYTLGTASVTQGMTAVEVAERLDHSGTETVKHYFKNTEHLWEVIQSATSARIEQKDFVARFMSKDVLPSNMYTKEITERKTFTTVGGCFKGSPCHLEPAVACYSCPEFKPNDNAEGHRHAKEVIVEMHDLAKKGSSTGEIQYVLDEALTGVEAAIKYAEDRDSVFNINDDINAHIAVSQGEHIGALVTKDD